MKTLIIIPSRLSATRLPGKPLLKINGLSIISHVFKKAEETNIGEVFVATEDQAIIDDVLPGVTWHDDIYPALYTKLAINCVINPLTAILNVPNGDLSASHLHDDMHAIIHEVVEAARMVHVELTPSDLFATVLKVIHDTRDNFSSMQQDIAHGRKTEIEHINGYISCKQEQY